MIHLEDRGPVAAPHHRPAGAAQRPRPRGPRAAPRRPRPHRRGPGRRAHRRRRALLRRRRPVRRGGHGLHRPAPPGAGGAPRRPAPDSSRRSTAPRSAPGTQLAVACDLRVATPAARFGIPAARLGLMVDHWTIQRLSLLAGAGPARAMLLGAETYSGEEAVRLGLVQRLGDLEAALGWADEIAALAPLTLAGLEAGPQPPRDAGGAGRRPRRARRLGPGVGERGPAGGHRRVPRAPPARCSTAADALRSSTAAGG